MLNKINDEKDKFNYLINILDIEILSSVSELVYNPPNENPFTVLKNQLLKLFENSIAQNKKHYCKSLLLVI